MKEDKLLQLVKLATWTAIITTYALCIEVVIGWFMK